ncbi:hypothetical protein QVD17_15231 [Tagetes erecta]|uniref:Uncharacterized protein n=1 Tax=Tagetes erecta TaxID=13708 RepID=A0AAD8NZI0_TARER|nr:hypothetical protein QVD17_15231 [Tagetes erecta]
MKESSDGISPMKLLTARVKLTRSSNEFKTRNIQGDHVRFSAACDDGPSAMTAPADPICSDCHSGKYDGDSSDQRGPDLCCSIGGGGDETSEDELSKRRWNRKRKWKEFFLLLGYVLISSEFREFFGKLTKEVTDNGNGGED